MSPAGSDGTAREVPLDRLAAFAAADPVDEGFALPRRRSAGRQIDLTRPQARTGTDATPTTVPAPAAPAPAAAPAQQAAPAAPAAPPRETVPSPAPDSSARRTGTGPSRSRTRSARTREPAAAQGDPGTVGLDKKIRASNVHIPVSLLEAVRKEKADTGLDHAAIIIRALEETYEDLKELITPTRSGGKLFAERTAKASRGEEALTPLNYRMTEGDFAILDDLVDKCTASSRGHLITTALSAYFKSRSKPQS